MQAVWKILLSILLLALIGIVIGDQQNYSLGSITPYLQINHANNGQPSDNILASAGMFVGSIKSNKYHYPNCSAAKKIKPENEIWFSSSADAHAHGYVPCGICHPP